MTLNGYTMMCEQAGSKQLVRDVALARKPALTSRSSATTSRGWTPRATARTHGNVLGAAAQPTRSIPLMTYVTCPIRRYQPAVVAQRRRPCSLLAGQNTSAGS